MNIERTKVLLIKHFENSLSEDEKLELSERLKTISDKQLHELLAEVDTPSHDDPMISAEDIERRLQHVLDKIMTEQHFSVVDSPDSEIRKKAKFRRLRRILAVAAMTLLIATFGYYLYQPLGTGQEAVAVDIEPARSFAIIALDNGDSIQVDSDASGVIYAKNGVKIFKDKKGEIAYQILDNINNTALYLTVNTPKGGVSKVKLADGTLVRLNAASSLRYPVAFSGTSREVSLEGEAFFEVAHDHSKPFRVHSNKQRIEVLGTSFNLVSQPSYAKTTLLEGSVRLIVGEKGYLLKPGEEATVADEVQIRSVKVAESVAWKNEEFIFDNSTLYEKLQEIENWYNVKMVFSDKNVENVKLFGSVSRNVKLSALLKVLEMNTDYTFKIEGRRVFVGKK